MAVRSKEFARGETAGSGQFVVYTCPVGKTSIIKDLRCTNQGAPARVIVWLVTRGASSVWLRSRAVLSNLDNDIDLCFVVLEPGDQLEFFADGADVHYYVCGAELDGVA